MDSKFINLKNVRLKFRRASQKTRPGLKDAMMESLLFLHQETPSYPPEPPGSSYDRKGSAGLGGSITTLQGASQLFKQGELGGALSRVEDLGGEVQGIWGTGRIYGPLVVDEKEQAKVHQGRWWTMQEVFRDNLKNIVNIFKEKFKWPIK